MCANSLLRPKWKNSKVKQLFKHVLVSISAPRASPDLILEKFALRFRAPKPRDEENNKFKTIKWEHDDTWFWDGLGMIWGMRWGTVWGWCWDEFGIIWGWSWTQVGITLYALWNHGIISLASCLHDLGCLCDQCGLILNQCLNALWNKCCTLVNSWLSQLGIVWDNVGTMIDGVGLTLKSCWIKLGIIVVWCWDHVWIILESISNSNQESVRT